MNEFSKWVLESKYEEWIVIYSLEAVAWNLFINGRKNIRFFRHDATADTVIIRFSLPQPLSFKARINLFHSHTASKCETNIRKDVIWRHFQTHELPPLLLSMSNDLLVH